MVQVSNRISSFDLSQHPTKGLNLIPQKGFEEILAKTYQTQNQQGQNPLPPCSQANRQNRGDGILSKEERTDLAARYNPTNMTQEEYRALVDELCELGIFDQDDKPYLSCEGMMFVHISELCIEISHYTGPSYPTLESCNGNVLGWSRYKASFSRYDEATQTFSKSRTASLHCKLETVLTQLMR